MQSCGRRHDVTLCFTPDEATVYIVSCRVNPTIKARCEKLCSFVLGMIAPQLQCLLANDLSDQHALKYQIPIRLRLPETKTMYCLPSSEQGFVGNIIHGLNKISFTCLFSPTRMEAVHHVV